VRLNRFLAAAGLGSRRHCDELIGAGRVTINGKVCTNFSAQPAPRDHVKLDGRLVRAAPALTIMLNKPAGFVSTRRDPHARDTVFDLIPEKFSNLFTIGRLDAQTQGLLLLTNDGELAQRLSHPRFKVDKEYEVTLDRPWNPELAPKLERGVLLDGQRAKIARLRWLSSTRLRIILRQGINRQIRRMFQAIGYRVKNLVRIRVGNLHLADLPCGHWRALTQSELKALGSSDSSRVVAAGADRGRRQARRIRKPGSTPPAISSNETRRL
jgi:23S rRNA pseudouridine2605 synthase